MFKTMRKWFTHTPTIHEVLTSMDVLIQIEQYILQTFEESDERVRSANKRDVDEIIGFFRHNECTEAMQIVYSMARELMDLKEMIHDQEDKDLDSPVFLRSIVTRTKVLKTQLINIY